MKTLLISLLLLLSTLINAQSHYGSVYVNGRIISGSYYGTAIIGGQIIHTSINSNGRVSSYSYGGYRNHSFNAKDAYRNYPSNTNEHNIVSQTKKHKIYNINNNNGDVSFIIVSKSISYGKLNYIGGTIFNITFLYYENNLFNSYPWSNEYCAGKFIKNDIIKTEKNEISRVGGILMYKINNIPYIDVDLGCGLLKEIKYDTEYFYRITDHTGHTSIGKDITNLNSTYKPTLNCMVSLDIVSIFNNGEKKTFIIQPNILISSIEKPIIGINLGIKFKNFNL